MSTTQAYPLVRQLAEGWEKLYPSATCSGIIGDRAHQERGGYHIGRAFQSTSNYSVVRVDDRQGMGPGDASAGIDMSMSTKDMILCTKRLQAVWANPNDPRRKYLNAFNGWLGKGNAIRFDVVRRSTEYASPDHKWHIHLEIRRRWILTRTMVIAVLSALAGESIAAYLKEVGVTAQPVQPAGKTATAKGPQVPAYPGRVLQRNDRQARPDPALKTWQLRMIARGWASIGKADGMFGARTEDVTKRFQATCRLQPDGKIGPATWPRPWTQPMGS